MTNVLVRHLVHRQHVAIIDILDPAGRITHLFGDGWRCGCRPEPYYEVDLAKALLDELDDHHKDEALVQLVHEHTLSWVTVDCWLDETDDGSYKAAEAAAIILLEEIRRQGSVKSTLNTLVKERIVSNSDSEAFERTLP